MASNYEKQWRVVCHSCNALWHCDSKVHARKEVEDHKAKGHRAERIKPGNPLPAGWE